ncbi:hypothetical protein N658DRAFT_466820 [Parathielavia hyrcaniae]|uniref:Uncharacterized protein n=1 Tax=Parathielavia hyrcaniae TaxID=113614 RepID=A0AAN6Q4Q4_9PEZI|nr:hypothetical protein N658DRAFT_466820 [Parathielavia hyrcaniae]
MSPDSEISRALNGDGPPTASPSRHPSISLQAAATLNAGLQRESPSRGSDSPSLPFRNRSPSTGRRRSQVLANLHIADPSAPAPGEMVADNQPSNYQPNTPHPVTASPRLTGSGVPHHNRTPSLGELHQELENEQEFQVNRLLGQIRQLQEQLQRQQQNQSAVVGDETSDRSAPLPISTSSPQQLAAYPSSGSLPRSPVFPRSSFDLARADLRHRSRTPSRNASPRLRSESISADSGEPWALGGRDESAFYQAESQMLVRENQMLRHRIRELERQLSEVQGNHNASLTHEPSHPSHLTHSVSASEEDSARQTPAPASRSPAGKAD